MHATQPQGDWANCELVGDAFVVRCAYSEERKAAIKALPRRMWDAEHKYWRVPLVPQNAGPFAALVRDHGLTMSPAAAARLQTLCSEAEHTPMRRLEVTDDGSFALITPYNPDLTEAFKAAVAPTDRQWDKERRRWRVLPRPAALQNLFRFAAAHDVHVAQQVITAAERALEAHQAMLRASQAQSAAIAVPGFGSATMQPYPYQQAGIAYAAHNKCCVIADQMGLGKTCEALGTIQVLGAYPAIIVCPATVKLVWTREALRWIPGIRCAVLNGVKPYPLSSDLDLIIVNFDILHAWVEVLRDLHPGAVIFDEAHMVKEPKARRSQAALALAEGVPVRLALSGTPILNRPYELAMLLQVIGRIDAFGGRWKFLQRHCAPHHNGYHWDFSGASYLDEMNETLRAGGMFIRRTKDEVLSELPPLTRAEVPLEIDNRAEYERTEDDVARWFAEEAIADQDFLESIAHLSSQQRAWATHVRAQSAEMQARRGEDLVRWEALKVMAARGKLAAALAWMHDFLETGEPLIVFAHHKEIQRALYEALAPYHPARLWADDTAGARQANIDRFQTDPSCQVIVCSLMAGGVGVTLTKASALAILELPFSPAVLEQAEARAHRIGTQRPVTAYYLLAVDTVDQEIAAIIQSKAEVVDAATEGNPVAAQERVLASLAQAVAQRRAARARPAGSPGHGAGERRT